MAGAWAPAIAVFYMARQCQALQLVEVSLVNG